MNELLFANSYLAVCEQLLAIRASGEWREISDSFDEYVVERWSLSKTRAKFLCDFAKFVSLCRKAGIDLPETPENVKPVLGLPQKRWLEVWELILSFAPDQRSVNAKFCQSVMDRFSVIGRKRLPEHVLNGQRLRRAAKTLAELEDGERVAEQIGARGFGKNWDKAVEVAIDADQAKRNAATGD